jgi:hypothetical protein
MHRLAERHAVQRVRPRARGQRAHDAVGQGADHRVERVRLLDPLGQGRGPASPAGLAMLAGPAVGREGWRHT